MTAQGEAPPPAKARGGVDLLLLHRRANLEHAAAEPANLFQAVMLLILLRLPLLAIAGPPSAPTSSTGWTPAC